MQYYLIFNHFIIIITVFSDGSRYSEILSLVCLGVVLFIYLYLCTACRQTELAPTDREDKQKKKCFNLVQ